VFLPSEGRKPYLSNKNRAHFGGCGLSTALDSPYRLSISTYLTLAHIDGRGLNPMVNQRSANVAATAVKAMPTVTETAAANG